MGLSRAQLPKLTRKGATADAAAECLVFFVRLGCLLRRDGESFTPAELVDVLETACSKLRTALAQDYGHAST